jgi:type I restriction enzyme S subunit
MSSTKICKLSEVITIQNGYAFPSKKFTAEEGMPLIRIRDLKNGIKTQTKYSGEFDESYLVKSGDLLIGMDGEFKCYEWKGSPALLNQRVCRIQNINETFDLKYLYYGINSYLKAIEDVTGYTTVKHLSSSTILNIEFPVPSLEKQREIVEKLDSAFTEIDLLEENLGLGDKKANQLLQSFLSSAFSSTAEENDLSNDPGDETIASNLVALGTVAEVIAGQSPEGIYYNSNGNGTPFYQGKKEFGEKYLGEATTWTTKITKMAEPGDILMSVRAPVGPINFSTQQICIGRGLAAIRAQKLVDKNYLFYFLLHKQPEISGNTGAVFDSINKDQIASIEIPVPSLEKQIEIVNKLDIAFEEIEKLKLQIKSERDSAAALRQSLLNSAFAQQESVA